ncbi:serine/threonine-protein kinase [Actinomadura bangladeshensis]
MAGPIPLDTSDPARLGGWELLARLGTGGQGMVYLGRPLDPDARPSRVAVKLLHARLLGDADARERFVRELALLQRVAGFCTAQMLAADMAGDRPYIVSEYVPGPSLRALVQDRGPRTGADLDRLAISSVTALSAIHRANVAHRDFKPQNVLMGPDGPRVIDFGIARAFDAGATLTSQVVGTPAYMAPEQFAGRAGPAADLFAWAGTLLFAATARDPFAGGSLPAVMYKIMHETPDLTPLPGPLAEVAAACLSKDPSTRPTSEEVLLWLLGHRSPRTATRPEPAAPVGPAQNPGTAAESGTAPHRDAPGAPFDPAVPPGRGWSAGGPSDQAQAPGATADPATAPYGAAPGGAGAAFNPDAPQGWGRSAGGPPGSAQGAGTAVDPATAPYSDAPGGARAGGPAGPAPGSGATPDPGTASYGGPAGGPAGALAVGRVRRGAALVGGLVLAGVLAALDVAALAILIARPGLSEGHRGGLLPVVASSFAVVAVVTLVAVILAWRGSRGAAWTVLAARVVRVAMWGAWGALVQVQASALAGHAVLTAVVVVLLARGLSRS